MAVLKGIDVIRRWVIQTRLKEQTKQGGVMITLPKKEFVDLNTSITADRLLRSGIDIDQLTSVGQVDNLINQINKRSVISQGDPRFEGIMNQLMGKKGEVVDMRGQKIPPGSKIMGGQAVDDLPPPGSRGGPDDIAAPVQSQEETLRNMTEAEMKREIESQNKSAIEKMRKRKNREGVFSLEDYDTTNMSEIQKQIIKLETRLGNLNPELPGFRERAKVLVDEITTLQNKMKNKPEEFQKGGIARIGLKDGPKMSRRTFLKYLTGAVALPIIGKFFKPVKGVSKVSKVPMIKTGDAVGKPEWFDQLVNKVILEGDDVTKKFATKDREIVHRKKIDEDSEVIVTQDLEDGTVRVDYDSPENMGQDRVMLQYKPGITDETTGGKKPRDRFDATEAEPRFVGGPEDADIEFDSESGGPGLMFLESDVSKLKQYATGKGPTMKEFIESKKRKDYVAKINDDSYEAAQHLSGKYGDGPDKDYYDDFASGGIAGMLGE